MSPILVRPVREQLEHDRVIRLLQVKLKRKHEVIANIGEDQSTSVKIGQLQIYPGPRADDRGPRPQADGHRRSGNVGVGQPPGGAVPVGAPRPGAGSLLSICAAGSVDIARRLATENHVHVSEIWSFHTIGDQTHFRLVHRTPDDTRRSSEPRGIVTYQLGPVPPKPVVRASGPAGCRRSKPPHRRRQPRSRSRRRSAAPVMPNRQPSRT